MDSIALGADSASVGIARGFVASRLIDRQLDPTAAVLCTSELVTNVVAHTNTEFTVAIGFDRCVRVEVHDGAAATDAFREMVANPPTAPVTAFGGRGLGLVRTVATRFGLAEEPGIRGGKIVWFEIDTEDRPASR